jgi:hypothetical protein
MSDAKRTSQERDWRIAKDPKTGKYYFVLIIIITIYVALWVN